MTNLVQMSVRAGRGVEGGVSETWPSPDLESTSVVAPHGSLAGHKGQFVTAPDGALLDITDHVCRGSAA